MNSGPSSTLLAKRALKLSLQNFWRNKFLSIATVFVIGIIIFIFNIILSINFIAQDAISNLSRKVDMVIYLKDSTTYSQTTEIINQIKNINGVEDVKYTSKEDALKEMKVSNPNLSLAFDKYGLGNPLPASLNINTKNPEDHAKVSEVLAKPEFSPYLSNIVSDNNQQESKIISSVSENLSKVSQFTKQVILWLIITFLCGGVLIILNSLHITIFTRRQEISVMKLVGAPYHFIRLPYILESILYGILAVLIGFGILLGLSGKIGITLPHLAQYFGLELFLTIILSGISSFFAVHKYLSSKEI